MLNDEIYSKDSKRSMGWLKQSPLTNISDDNLTNYVIGGTTANTSQFPPRCPTACFTSDFGSN